MRYNFYPSDAYIKSLAKVPRKLGSNYQETHEYRLVVIHYNSKDFESTRWTTRTRDIYAKKAKMLQFDMCNAYLFEISRFNQFIENLNLESFMFLAYRLYGTIWKSTVEEFNHIGVSSIECYDYPALVL